MITRRTFLVTGAAGSAALALAWWLHGARRRASGQGAPGPLDAGALAVLSACVPVMLEGGLPPAGDGHASAVRETVANVAVAVAGLPPAAQHELHELFALLDWAPTRLALAGLTTSWAEADRASVGATLERWRTGRIDLLRTAYDALHQLIAAAWYGNPRSWAAIGYEGPPQLD